MKYTAPIYLNEEIEVLDVINVSIIKVSHVNKQIPTGEVDENGAPVMENVTATQVSVDISNLF